MRRGLARGLARLGSGALALGIFAGSGAAGLVPAQASAQASAQAGVQADDTQTSYGGFSTVATASPLKLEVFEPAIPIPTEPQFEMDFSYTRVLGDSGPATSARASAMWPGPSIGDGLTTFGQQLGLPPQLYQNGYPVQVNSQYPSDTTQAADEPFPGMIQRVNSGEKKTTAKAGYTGSGDLADGDAGDAADTSDSSGSTTPPPTNPLQALLGGDLTALTGLLSTPTTGNDEQPVQTNPMGALSLLIDFDGMTSVSTTTYDADKVTSIATSRIGEIRLLMGLIKLTGINVVTKATSTLDGGAKTSQTVDVGGMTIAGQKFSYGPDGFTAAGATTPVPGLPTQATDLLKMLGVQIEVPKPEVTTDGSSGKVDAEAVRITLDTKPLRKVLPQLPLDPIVAQLPDLQQGNVLKGMLLSLNTISPRLVLHLGQASASAATVAPVDFGGGEAPATSGESSGSASSPGTSGTAGTAGTPTTGAVPPSASTPTTTPVNELSAVPGLPALGSVPMLLTVAGLALAGGIGWYLRRAGVLLFGAGAVCSHGLKAGIPDLRKA